MNEIIDNNNNSNETIQSSTNEHSFNVDKQNDSPPNKQLGKTPGTTPNLYDRKELPELPPPVPAKNSAARNSPVNSNLFESNSERIAAAPISFASEFEPPKRSYSTADLAAANIEPTHVTAVASDYTGRSSSFSLSSSSVPNLSLYTSPADSIGQLTISSRSSSSMEISAIFKGMQDPSALSNPFWKAWNDYSGMAKKDKDNPERVFLWAQYLLEISWAIPDNSIEIYTKEQTPLPSNSASATTTAKAMAATTSTASDKEEDDTVKQQPSPGSISSEETSRNLVILIPPPPSFLLLGSEFADEEFHHKHAINVKFLPPKNLLQSVAHKHLKKLATVAPGVGKSPPADVQFFLANLYTTGKLMDIGVDHYKAFCLYVAASKQNHPEATYRVGVAYEIGAGTKKNSSRSFGFYKKAAALGETNAMHRVGKILLEGQMGIAVNQKEGLTWLKRAASLANDNTPVSLYDLAMCYEPNMSIDGVISDSDYAYELYLKAASYDYPPALARLGRTFEFGELGKEIDPVLSLKYYTRGASLGSSDCELGLSGWYLTGAEDMVRQSNIEAYSWALKAALKNNPKAMFAVGHFLENGIGVEKNINESFMWYAKAAELGYRKSVLKVADMKRARKAENQPPFPPLEKSQGNKKRSSFSRRLRRSSECIIS